MNTVLAVLYACGYVASVLTYREMRPMRAADYFALLFWPVIAAWLLVVWVRDVFKKLKFNRPMGKE